MKINPIEVVSVSQIQGNKSNPRYIKDKEFKELVESVRKFPKMMEARPIIVDENGIILGGNMRYKAALELGYKEVHIVRITDATEEQKREFIIKDNVSKGSWDWDMLANEWDKEQLEEWGLTLNMFTDDEDLEYKGDEDYEVGDCQVVLNFTQSQLLHFNSTIYAHGTSKEGAILKLLGYDKENAD